MGGAAGTGSSACPYRNPGRRLQRIATCRGRASAASGQRKRGRSQGSASGAGISAPPGTGLSSPEQRPPGDGGVGGGGQRVTQGLHRRRHGVEVVAQGRAIRDDAHRGDQGTGRLRGRDDHVVAGRRSHVRRGLGLPEHLEAVGLLAAGLLGRVAGGLKAARCPVSPDGSSSPRPADRRPRSTTQACRCNSSRLPPPGAPAACGM